MSACRAFGLVRKPVSLLATFIARQVVYTILSRIRQTKHGMDQKVETDARWREEASDLESCDANTFDRRRLTVIVQYSVAE